MPLPILLVGAAAAAGIAGIAKGVKAASNNSRANELISEAQDLYNETKDKLESQKENTTCQLNMLAELKLESWSQDIGSFIEIFSQFKNVQLQSKVELDNLLQSKIEEAGNLKQMEVASVNASEVLKLGTSSLGAGALAGIASYGGAMMFASASTGTAISALSGAAATNATLAWFGGGSLAAGGFGMAGGAAVLGGIVVAPIAAVAGFLMEAKSEENLSKAKKIYAEAENASEKMKTMISILEKIEELANAYEVFIRGYRYKYQNMLRDLQDMAKSVHNEQGKYFVNIIKKFFGLKYKIDFNLLKEEQKKLLHISWLSTQVLNAVLSTSLLTHDGNIDENAYSVLESAENSSMKLLTD